MIARIPILDNAGSVSREESIYHGFFFFLFIYVGVWLELRLTQRLGQVRKEPPRLPELQMAVAMMFWHVLIVIVLRKSRLSSKTISKMNNYPRCATNELRK